MRENFKLFGAWLLTVNIFNAIKKFYGALIDLIGFIVDKTSDQGADIAIRALPIVSPLPNAISMYYVSQTALHFTDWQAKAFAAAMELALFGLFEVVLKMFDGWQKNPTRYSIPLRLATGIAVFVMFLIMGVVLFVESTRPILATLPLFSAAGAAALSLRRWHAHNEQVDSENERARLEAKAMRGSGKLYVAKNTRTEQIQSSGEHNNEQIVVSTEQSRQDALFNLIERFGDIGPTEFAKRLGVKSRTTVYKDLQAMNDRGVIHQNGAGWTPGPHP